MHAWWSTFPARFPGVLLKGDVAPLIQKPRARGCVSELYTGAITPGKPPYEALRIENCLAEICHWINSNELKLNHDKTEIMLIHSRYRNKPPVDDFNIELEKVPITAALVKSLGVGFDEHMMFDSYVADKCLPFTI
jgi:hypothetical protein